MEAIVTTNKVQLVGVSKAKQKPLLIWAVMLLVVVSLQGCVNNPVKPSTNVDEGKLITKSTSLPFLGLPSPKSVDEALTNGDQAFNQADLNLALFEYVRALDLDAKNPKIYVKIGKTHVKMKNDGVAHFAFTEALKLDKSYISALEGMGNLLLRNNKVTESKSYFQQAISLFENATIADAETISFPITAYTSMGIALDMENDPKSAIDYYYKALNKAPYSYSIHNNIGYSYYLSGEWLEAERFYSRALELNNKYKLAWKNLGLLYARQDRFMEAMNAFEQVMEKPKAYNDIGYICLMDGKYDEAEIFLAKAIDSNPRYYKIAEQNLEKVYWHKQLAESNRNTLKPNKGKTKKVVFRSEKIAKPIAQQAPIKPKKPIPVAPMKAVESKQEVIVKPRPLSMKTTKAQNLSVSQTPSESSQPMEMPAIESDSIEPELTSAVSLPEGSAVNESSLRYHWKTKQ